MGNPRNTLTSTTNLALEPDDEIFSDLNSLKDSLAKTNQPLIPAIITIFSAFKKQIIEDMQVEFKNSLDIIKNECFSACQKKDVKIKDLEKLNNGLQKQIVNQMSKYTF